jgi:transposase
LRKQELKHLKKELPHASYEQEGQGTLWLLRKNHAHLDAQEKVRLRRLFLLAPNLHLAYTFRKELSAIFNQAQTRTEGVRRLSAWIQKVQHCSLTCYDGFIKTLRTHWNPILNYFVARVTSGFVEGLNHKIKLIKRRCYGIKKVATLFQRSWLDLQGAERFFLSTP